MSTIVQMPVRVKPPPADTGEIISPGCASFEIATPSNGARTIMSARSVSLRGDLALGDLRPAAAPARSAPSASRPSPAPCRPRRGRRPSPSPAARGGSSCRSASRSRASSSAAARRAAVSCACGDGQRRAQLRVVEPREHLALLDGLAFLDEDLEDLAGHLRRHRRAPPGRDVARGVQDRARRRAAAGRAVTVAILTGAAWTRWSRTSRRPRPRATTTTIERNRSRRGRRRRARVMVDLERSEVVFEIGHRKTAELSMVRVAPAGGQLRTARLKYSYFYVRTPGTEVSGKAVNGGDLAVNGLRPGAQRSRSGPTKLTSLRALSRELTDCPIEASPASSRGSGSRDIVMPNMMSSQKKPDTATTQVSRVLQRTSMKKRMTSSALVQRDRQHDDVVERAEVDERGEVRSGRCRRSARRRPRNTARSDATWPLT